MMKEGLPEPSRFFSSTDTGSLDQHSDVLQRILKNERQVEEKPQRDENTISPETFSSYVRTWYAFYSADPPFLQISLFFMHLHRPPEHCPPKYRCTAYCPVDFRLTENRPTEPVEHRPTDYKYRLTDTLSTCTVFRSTDYRPTASCLPDRCFIEHRTTVYQFPDFTVFPNTDLPITGLPISDLPIRSLDYRPIDYRLPTHRLLTTEPSTTDCPTAIDYRNIDYRLPNHRLPSTDYRLPNHRLPTHRLPTTDCTDYSKYQLPPTNYKYLRTYPSTAMYNVLTTNPSTTSVPTHRLPTTDYIPIDDRLLTTDYQLPTD